MQLLYGLLLWVVVDCRCSFIADSGISGSFVNGQWSSGSSNSDGSLRSADRVAGHVACDSQVSKLIGHIRVTSHGLHGSQVSYLIGHMGHGSWITWVANQLLKRSHGSLVWWVTGQLIIGHTGHGSWVTW